MHHCNIGQVPIICRTRWHAFKKRFSDWYQISIHWTRVHRYMNPSWFEEWWDMLFVCFRIIYSTSKFETLTPWPSGFHCLGHAVSPKWGWTDSINLHLRRYPSVCRIGVIFISFPNQKKARKLTLNQTLDTSSAESLLFMELASILTEMWLKIVPVQQMYTSDVRWCQFSASVQFSLEKGLKGMPIQ